MYLCRAALQRFSPLIKSSVTNRAILHRDVVPRRFMSSVPGGTGENLVYLVLCGGAFAGALTYAYRTVTSDSARYTDRIREIEARTKNDWKPKTWPPKNAEEATEVTTEPPVEAANEPATEAATEPTTEAATEPSEEAATEAATEPSTEAATEPSAEAATEKAAVTPVELVAEVEAKKTDSMVEEAAEAVAMPVERVVEVDGIVKETAEEVAAVVQEMENKVKKVEAGPVVKEDHGAEAASQEEANTEA